MKAVFMDHLETHDIVSKIEVSANASPFFALFRLSVQYDVHLVKVSL